MVRPQPVPLARGIIAALLVSMAPAALAAGAQSEALAVATAARADRHYEARHYETARLLFDRAARQANAAGDAATEALARRGLGLTLIKQAKYASARAALLASLDLFETLQDQVSAGWILHHLGWLSWEYATDRPSDFYWSRGLEKMQRAGDPPGEAQLLSDRAAAMRPGPDSVAAFQRALKLAREIGATGIAGDALFGLARHQYWTGQYADALKTFQEANAAFVQAGASDREADVNLELGRLHDLHGSGDRARDYYKRGRDIVRSLNDKPRTALALGATVSMHRTAGQLTQAVAASRQLIALRMTFDAPRAINLERLRLAWIYLDMGRPRDAKPLVEAVMRGPDAFSRDLSYEPFAQTYLGLGEYARAREASEAALRTLRETAERPFLLHTRARISEKLGNREAALADVDTALALVEDARTRLVQSDAMKQGYGERLQRLFAFAVDLRMRSGRTAHALEAAEQARARAFLDRLAARRAPPGEAPADSDVRGSAAATPASVQQLAATARRLDSVIVSYWVAPAKTFIWVVDGEGRVKSASVPVPASRLAALIGQTSAEVGVSAHPPTTVWRELHEWLIRPVQAFFPDTRGTLLTIIPHGPLFRLSFAALLDRRRTYLIERFRLHYVPSGGSLTYLEPGRAVRDDRTRYLFVADPDGRASTPGMSLPRLPGALQEISAIAATVPRERTTTLTGAQATEARLREMLPGHTVLHLATHGRLSDAPGADSFLALAGSGTSPPDDGRLTTDEIYEMTLGAELVVLSACRSGRGPVTGEGVLGMTRAFLYAGAPSIVASLWDVADRSGSELMPAFYRLWLQGSDKSAALRDAQLAMIAKLRSGRIAIQTPTGPRRLPEHPFLWAAFVLVGEL